MNRSSRKSFLDDLLGDDSTVKVPSSVQRPSTAGSGLTGSTSLQSNTSSKGGKSVRFSEGGRDQEFSSFDQQRSLSSSLDHLFGNDSGHGNDEDDILGSISFTRGSRSAASGGGEKNYTVKERERRKWDRKREIERERRKEKIRGNVNRMKDELILNLHFHPCFFPVTLLFLSSFSLSDSLFLFWVFVLTLSELGSERKLRK